MNRKARQELIGIGALAVGLFLGLTLLRLPITGSWGDRIGSLLWRGGGAGAGVLPGLRGGWGLGPVGRARGPSPPPAAPPWARGLPLPPLRGRPGARGSVPPP